MSFGLPEGQGWIREDRPFDVVETTEGSTTPFMLPMHYRGTHTDECTLTDYGWRCADGCTVEDMPTMPVHFKIIDDLIDVEEVTKRRSLTYQDPEGELGASPIYRRRLRWPKVDWSMTRVSVQQRFTNARMAPDTDEIVNRQTWFQGTTWTKWGARRKMRWHALHGRLLML